MNDNLLEHIEELREKMISVGMEHGFTNEETLKLSRMLDDLINQQIRKLHKIPLLIDNKCSR
jgi:hypothetical protein